MPTEGLRFKLLRDDPADEDAFALHNETGPHQRIADTIVDMIPSDEAGGKMIGLEGRYGGGKSSIVDFVVKALALNPDHRVVIFNAWSHQDDPLRRSVLEVLIKDTIDAGWINNNAEWEHRKDELAKRRRVEETLLFPGTTWFGIVMATFLVLLPSTVSNLLTGLELLGDFHWTSPFNWRLTEAFVVCGLFVVFVFANALKIKRAGSNWREIRNWPLVQGKGIEKTKTTVVQSPDPTSIEFGNLFEELMKDALELHEGRRLVVVVDNLDRVAEDDARSI